MISSIGGGDDRNDDDDDDGGGSNDEDAAGAAVLRFKHGEWKIRYKRNSPDETFDSSDNDGSDANGGGNGDGIGKDRSNSIFNGRRSFFEWAAVEHYHCAQQTALSLSPSPSSLLASSWRTSTLVDQTMEYRAFREACTGGAGSHDAHDAHDARHGGSSDRFISETVVPIVDATLRALKRVKKTLE